MNISRKQEAEEIKVGSTLIAYEYPLLDKALHGAVAKINGRYPEKGRIVNEKCLELVYVVEGKGIIVLDDETIKFEKGDQILIKQGVKYYWDAKATLYMPCAPAWYPEQHKEVE